MSTADLESPQRAISQAFRKVNLCSTPLHPPTDLAPVLESELSPRGCRFPAVGRRRTLPSSRWRPQTAQCCGSPFRLEQVMPLLRQPGLSLWSSPWSAGDWAKAKHEELGKALLD